MPHHVTPRRLSCKVFREIHETGCGGPQRVETVFPVAVNPRVAGSSPARGANRSKGLGHTSLAPFSWCVTICVILSVLFRTHASHALERGAPVALVRGTLGHKSIATTNT